MLRISLVEHYAAAMTADGLIEDEYEQAKELIDKVKGL